jgi:hypothetical protein
MQFAPVNSRTIFRWIEYAYAAALIFVLTQGPVLSLWFASEQENARPALAPQLATYFLFQIPALVFVSRQKFTLRDARGPLGLLTVFCIWLTATTLWATNGQHSAVESVSLLTTFVCGVYFAKRFTLREKLAVIVVAITKQRRLLGGHLFQPQLTGPGGDGQRYFGTSAVVCGVHQQKRQIANLQTVRIGKHCAVRVGGCRSNAFQHTIWRTGCI